MGFSLSRQGLGGTMTLLIVLLGLFAMRWMAQPPADGVIGTGFEGVPDGVIVSLCERVPVLVKAILSFVILLWNALIIMRILIRNMIVLEKSYMPFIIYPIVGVGVWFNPSTFSIFIVSFLLVSSFDLMIDSFRRNVLYNKVFLSAFLIGLAPLLYMPSIVFLVGLFVSLILFNKTGREWIVACVGVIMPWAITSYIYWGVGHSFWYVSESMLQVLQKGFLVSGSFDVDVTRPMLLLFGAALLTLLVAALVLFLKRSSTIRVRPYKSLIYFFWLLLLSALPLVWPGRSAADFLLLAAPASIVIPFYLNRSSGKFQDAVYIVLIISIILYNINSVL